MKVGFTSTTKYLDAHLELTMKEYEDLKTGLLHGGMSYDPAKNLLDKIVELETQRGKRGYKQKINTFESAVRVDEEEDNKNYIYVNVKE